MNTEERLFELDLARNWTGWKLVVLTSEGVAECRSPSEAFHALKGMFLPGTANMYWERDE